MPHQKIIHYKLYKNSDDSFKLDVNSIYKWQESINAKQLRINNKSVLKIKI